MSKKIFAFCLIIFFSCSNSDQCSKPAPLNPNGDSELALLMREMFEDALGLKNQLKSEAKIKSELDYRQILTASATEPDKAASAEFKAFAHSYITMMDSLLICDTCSEKNIAIYSSMVNTCISCHQEMCPGPLVKIKKLK